MIWHDRGVYPSTPSEQGRDRWGDGGHGRPSGPGRDLGPGHDPGSRGYPAGPGRGGPFDESPYGRGERAPGPMPPPMGEPVPPTVSGSAAPPKQPAAVASARPADAATLTRDRTERTDRSKSADRAKSKSADRTKSKSADRAKSATEQTSDDAEPTPPVPVPRVPSLAVAGFAFLLGMGLILGAQTAGPDARVPFAVVIFGVQVLYVAAWIMALRPPAPIVVGVVCVAAAGAASAAAILPTIAGLAPLGFTAAAGFVVGVLGQLVRAKDRARVTDSLGATLLIVVGVVAFAALIVLSRRPLGTQAIFVCLTASAVALTIARLTDAVLPAPRLAPQVPRGASGVVFGAMLGTLAAAVLGRYLVGFTPTTAAVVGLVAGASAVLMDLAVGYLEAGRQMAGEKPTFWAARHGQGPLGGFALAAPVAYAVTVFLV